LAALWRGPLWRSARLRLLGGHPPDRQAWECGVWPGAYRSITLLNNMIPPLAVLPVTSMDGWAMPGSALRPLSASRSAREGSGGVVRSMKLQDACPRPGVAVLAGTLGPLLDVSLLVAALDVRDDRLVHLRRRRRRGWGWRSGLGLRLRRRLVPLCHGEPFPRPRCLCCR
jgi:hypothetical protein